MILDKVRHPGYMEVDNTEVNDLLVLKVEPSTKKTLKLNKEASIPQPPTSLTVMGHGETKDQDISTSLLTDKIPVQPDEDCEKQAGERFDKDKMLCAGDVNRHGCGGDSGGPVVTSFGTLVGVISFGPDCSILAETDPPPEEWRFYLVRVSSVSSEPYPNAIPLVVCLTLFSSQFPPCTLQSITNG